MISLQQTTQNPKPSIQPISNSESLRSDFLRSDSSRENRNNHCNVNGGLTADFALDTPIHSKKTGVSNPVRDAVVRRDHENSVRSADQVGQDRVTRFYLQSLARRKIAEITQTHYSSSLREDWTRRAIEALGAAPDDKTALKAWKVEARRLLGKKPSTDVSRGICGCLRWRVSKSEPVDILHVPSTQSAHYGNLQRCGNVWLCAVCGGVVSERRRVEMTEALARSGLFKMLVTYTIRHNRDDSLSGLYDALKKARARVKGHRQYKALMKRLNFVGHIYTLEPLHNLENGWHPHIHEIQLFASPLTDEQISELDTLVTTLWLAALAAQGHNADWLHGVDVRRGAENGRDYIAEYLAKFDRLPDRAGWSIEHEVTKSAVKRSSVHGRTTYELLLLYGQGDEYAGNLWLEFARAFKGAHQLQWSRGLKALLGVVDKSDEEILEEAREDSTILARLTALDWRIVVGNDCRAELLTVAAAGDFDRLQEWLSEIGVSALSPVLDDDVLPAADSVPPVLITISLRRDELHRPALSTIQTVTGLPGAALRNIQPLLFEGRDYGGSSSPIVKQTAVEVGTTTNTVLPPVDLQAGTVRPLSSSSLPIEGDQNLLLDLHHFNSS